MSDLRFHLSRCSDRVWTSTGRERSTFAFVWCRLREVEKERKAVVGTDVSLIQELTLQWSLEARNPALETRFHSHSHPNDDFFFFIVEETFPFQQSLLSTKAGVMSVLLSAVSHCQQMPVI